MKRILPLVFAISISAGPALAWGNGNCPFSKKGANQENATEEVKQTQSSKKD